MGKVSELLKKLTIEEKLNLLVGRDVWQTYNVDRLDIPSIFLSDGPHGLRKQLGDGDHLGINESIACTCFPTSATIVNSWDRDLGIKLGSALGQEAKQLGVNVILGPGMNIKRNPLCGRNFEYFSEDPVLSGKMAGSYITGIQSQNVAGTLKHFAVNNQELKRMSDNSVIDTRTMREIYLKGFEIAIKESKPYVVMSSYNKLNGIYTNEHKELLDTILRKEWGFDGMVVTDWGGGNDVVEGVKNGCNLEMPSTFGDSYKQLLQAYNDKKITNQEIDKRVEELLKVILKLTKDRVEITKEIPQAMIDEHRLIAKEAAEKSIVLLKNDENILPLKSTTKVGLIGDFADKSRYQGEGSSLVNAIDVDSMLSTVKGQDFNFIGYEQGYIRNKKTNKELIDRAKELASRVDVVVLCVGLEEIMESEGMDRRHMRIGQSHVELLVELAKVNKNIVTVLSGGSAVEMPWIDYTKGLVHGFLGGVAGGEAMWNILTGKVNPSGKLAETYPIEYADTPSYNYWQKNQATSEYRESIFVGYRYFDTANKKVRFPFGFGLSYTTFKYSDIKYAKNSITLTIKNTGKVVGSEIVQIYVGKKESEIFRANKELVAFEKVNLAAKESKTITIKLDDSAFQFFNIEKNSWDIENGTYQIMVGASVEDIKETINVEIKGSKINGLYNKEKLSNYYNMDIEFISDNQFKELLQTNIPDPNWNTNELLEMNSCLSQMSYAKRWYGRFAWWLISKLRDRSIKNGKPDLNLFFISNQTFRGIAKLTNGAVTMKMSEQILSMVNGHFFKGLGGLFKAMRNK